MNTIYCIYTDQELSSDKVNKEHIIPLSHGGCNELCIQVDKDKNSILGFEIDGKLSKDYLISSIRRRKDYKGHSGKIPESEFLNPKFKNTNKPVKITIKGTQSEFFDPIEKRVLTDNETKGISFSFNLNFDIDLRMIFTAKTLLAAGYFAYGKIFRQFADHNSLRLLMNYKIINTTERIHEIDVGIIDPFHEILEKDEEFVSIIKKICKTIDSSFVIFMLQKDNIIGSVAIGGEYIGTIRFNAKTEYFPNKDIFKHGHIISINNKKLKKYSYYEMTELLNLNS